MSILFFGMSSCSSVSKINPLNLLTTNDWAITSLSGGDLEMFDEELPFLHFTEKGVLRGFSGCNSFSGNFEISGTEINLSPGAMTRKACPGEGESKFIDALKNVSKFQISSEKLILLNGTTELMTLVPQNR